MRTKGTGLSIGFYGVWSPTGHYPAFQTHIEAEAIAVRDALNRPNVQQKEDGNADDIDELLDEAEAEQLKIDEVDRLKGEGKTDGR